MAKGYQIQDIKQKLVEMLTKSKTALSGVEISEKLGINRVTMAKYLNVFATEGIIRQKNIGNVNLWFIEEGTEQFKFPDDYFHAKTKYLELLTARNEQKIFSLIRNCIYSDANLSKLIIEVILPAIESVDELFLQGKITRSEQKFLNQIISSSIQMFTHLTIDSDQRKNVLIISADSPSTLIAEAASASFHSERWNVSLLGDMSDAIDVMFDLDLQKFLGSVWAKKNGIMIIIVFAKTEEGLKFFSQAVNSIKGKFGKNLHLILCTDVKKKSIAKSDLTSDNLETVLQWSQTTFEHFIT